jgi:hypothetical protein
MTEFLRRGAPGMQVRQTCKCFIARRLFRQVTFGIYVEGYHQTAPEISQRLSLDLGQRFLAAGTCDHYISLMSSWYCRSITLTKSQDLAYSPSRICQWSKMGLRQADFRVCDMAGDCPQLGQLGQLYSSFLAL